VIGISPDIATPEVSLFSIFYRLSALKNTLASTVNLRKS